MNDKGSFLLYLLFLVTIAGLYLWSPSKDTISFFILFGSMLGIIDQFLTYFGGSAKNNPLVRVIASSLMFLGLIAGSFSSPIRLLPIPFAYYLLLAGLVMGYLLIPFRMNLSSPKEYVAFDLLVLISSATFLLLSI